MNALFNSSTITKFLIVILVVTLPLTLWFILPIFLACAVFAGIFYLQTAYVVLKTTAKGYLLKIFGSGAEVKKSLNFGELVIASAYLGYNYVSKPLAQSNEIIGEKCVPPVNLEWMCILWDYSNKFTTQIIIYFPLFLVSVFGLIKIAQIYKYTITKLI